MSRYDHESFFLEVLVKGEYSRPSVFGHHYDGPVYKAELTTLPSDHPAPGFFVDNPVNPEDIPDVLDGLHKCLERLEAQKPMD
jgi:hypothetical protein